MTSAKMEIEQAVADARRQAAYERITCWLGSADAIEIVSEVPEMRKENSYVTTPEKPTGTVTITIKVRGVDVANATKIDGEWSVV